MKQCWVCGVMIQGIHSHHVWPRSSGGADGPLADLCANCHGAVHGGLERMKRGRSPDRNITHLPEDARERARTLIHFALAAHATGITNPRPLLSVSLDDPRYMHALDRFKLDRGFTSRDAAVNAILRELARSYGIMEERDGPNSAKTGKTTTFGAFRGSGRET